MLTAYLDESAESGEGYYVVGGYFGDDASWRRCATAWKACLMVVGRQSLHLNQMRLASSKAKGRTQTLLRRFAQIPARSGLWGVYGYVKRSDYSDLVRDNIAQIAMDGYPLALWPAVTSALRLVPPNESIRFFFEDQIEHATMRDLSMSMMSRQANLGGGANGERIEGWKSIPKNLLLEPADFLCYAVLQDLVDPNSQKALLTRPILENGQIFFQHFDQQYTHMLVDQMKRRVGVLSQLDRQEKRQTIETLGQMLAALKRANLSREEYAQFEAAMEDFRLEHSFNHLDDGIC